MSNIGKNADLMTKGDDGYKSKVDGKGNITVKHITKEKRQGACLVFLYNRSIPVVHIETPIRVRSLMMKPPSAEEPASLPLLSTYPVWILKS